MSIGPDFIVSRRTTLRWLVASIASNTMLTGCGGSEEEAAAQALADLGMPAMPDGVTYGTDPDLMNPIVPWTRTMTKQQLELAGTLSDAILPPSESTPAPSSAGVQEFIDEWVSAPYERQQSDREEVLDGLTWLEQESLDRFSVGFAGAEAAQRHQILDDIAFKDRVKPGLEQAAGFFRKFRYLAMSAWYSTEPGMAEIGYIGNTPLAGDYPGPTPEALAHLDAALKQLGLV